MNLFSKYLTDPWPDAKLLPAHVVAVQINPKLLLLHMLSAVKPSDRTKAGGK